MWVRKWMLIKIKRKKIDNMSEVSKWENEKLKICQQNYLYEIKWEYFSFYVFCTNQSKGKEETVGKKQNQKIIKAKWIVV